MWWDLLHAGYTPQDVRAVIRYLQREIRAGRLTPPPPPPPPRPVPPPLPSDPAECQRRHQETLDYLRQLRAALR